MTRLRWIGIRMREALGWPGLAGLTLLALLGATYWVDVHPLESRMQALRSAAVASASSSKQQKTQRPDPQTELAQFRAYFGGTGLEERLKAIHDVAKATGLNVKRVEYRMLEERRSGLRQYQIVMPVAASYPRVREFVALALAKVPALALDHIAFQRKKIGDAAVEAELRFTLFLAEAM
jgi:hypothetical protein